MANLQLNRKKMWKKETFK